MAPGGGAGVGVTEHLARRLLDSEVPLERGALVTAGLALIGEEAPLSGPDVVEAAVDAIVGLGPIEALLRDPAVSDVLVNGDGTVWVERAGELEPTDVHFDGPEAVRAAAERVIAPLGLRLDHASPAVDARLADGSRLHAVIPPVSVDGPVLAVRRFTEAVPDLDAMVASGGVDDAGAELLRAAVRQRRNLLVSGGTGSGKTTLLNVLSKEIPAGERVVTVEDAAELRLSGHVVRLEARPPNVEGAGAVELRQLVRHALRLRPDRIIVGEVRGPEALDMIQAMSTGHAGSMSTVHANGPEEALWRVETLALAGDARAGEVTVRRQLMAAVDVVVQVERRSGRRRVRAIAGVREGGVEVEWSSTD
jgi:pilus assembly protein CpaF